MKKTIKKILCVVLVASFVFALAGCAKINYVTNGTIKAIKEVQDGTYKNGGANASAEGEQQSEVTIDEFVAGTYGGVEFKTVEDVVNYYVECYNNTKSQTASYTENGEAKTYYSLLGEEKLKIESVLILSLIHI